MFTFYTFNVVAEYLFHLFVLDNDKNTRPSTSKNLRQSFLRYVKGGIKPHGTTCFTLFSRRGCLDLVIKGIMHCFSVCIIFSLIHTIFTLPYRLLILWSHFFYKSLIPFISLSSKYDNLFHFSYMCCSCLHHQVIYICDLWQRFLLTDL